MKYITLIFIVAALYGCDSEKASLQNKQRHNDYIVNKQTQTFIDSCKSETIEFITSSTATTNTIAFSCVKQYHEETNNR